MDERHADNMPPMKHSGKLKVSTPNDRDILFTREFNAPRSLVWEAFTTPELLKRWLFGPDGWSLAVCDIDLRVCGKYRYVWRHEGPRNVPGTQQCPEGVGVEMGMSGRYLEIVSPQKIVSTEKFDQEWYPGEAVGTVVFTEKAGKTFMTQTVTYPSRDVRDMVLKTPMESGMAMGYDRLERVLESIAVA
jgi:uncharacterized protein YndB with AHSA1/START domain